MVYGHDPLSEDDLSGLSDDSYTKQEIEEQLYSQVYHDIAGQN